MPKILYVEKRFGSDARNDIDRANSIISEYQEQGYVLTLRQLYYQFVSRGFIPNNQLSYKRLGALINDGRLAGLVDWEAIEDRTRNLNDPQTWESPAQILKACWHSFRIDKWATQPLRVEVWCEKEALAGVFERVSEELQIPYFSCRGYVSQSEMWTAGGRMRRILRGGQQVLILHFGDHDPSGLDMSRDIQERLDMFTGGGITFVRVALNMAQVEEYDPPPNPAKMSDSRAEEYVREHGNESWELDALEPQVLATMVRERVEMERDDEAWQAAVEVEEEHRRVLKVVAEQWATLTRGL